MGEPENGTYFTHEMLSAVCLLFAIIIPRNDPQVHLYDHFKGNLHCCLSPLEDALMQHALKAFM